MGGARNGGGEGSSEALKRSRHRTKEITMSDKAKKDINKNDKDFCVEGPPSSEDEIDSEEDEDLILEGVLVRNTEVASSDEDEGENDCDDSKQEPKKKRAKVEQKHEEIKPVKKSKLTTESPPSREVETIPVEFTFNDMDEKFYHGVQNQVSNQPVYAPHASDIASVIIENISVGTVVSSQDGANNVFGFASVLNVTTYNEKPCIQSLKKLLLDQCPTNHKDEMEIVLSGKTKRPAGFFVHGRMVNLPLEITFVLHEQLVLDMDWAVDNAEGGEDERKSLNFGAFIMLAPYSVDKQSHSAIYKNFDDEIFAGCAEFVYSIDLSKGMKKGEPPIVDTNEKNLVNVIVLTKTGHRDAMKELKTLVHG